MPSATIGQTVWFLDLDARCGPFPAVVVREGEAPLLAVHLPEGPARAQATHWLVEDGTTTGWLEIPAGGLIPGDLFD
jgi:hypothetical protein